MYQSFFPLVVVMMYWKFDHAPRRGAILVGRSEKGDRYIYGFCSTDFLGRPRSLTVVSKPNLLTNWLTHSSAP